MRIGAHHQPRVVVEVEIHEAVWRREGVGDAMREITRDELIERPGVAPVIGLIAVDRGDDLPLISTDEGVGPPLVDRDGGGRDGSDDHARGAELEGARAVSEGQRGERRHEAEEREEERPVRPQPAESAGERRRHREEHRTEGERPAGRRRWTRRGDAVRALIRCVHPVTMDSIREAVEIRCGGGRGDSVIGRVRA